MLEPILLKPKRDKPVRQRHPWVFTGAVQQLPDGVPDATVGDATTDIAPVLDADRNFLAWGYVNPASQICVRLLSWDPNERFDDDFWYRRLAAAVNRRAALIETAETTAYRLVNGESDYAPGLVVDRYDAHLVLQAGTLGIERRKARLAEMLQSITGCVGVVERSDMAVRRAEGLEPADGVLTGGVDPPGMVEVCEAGLHFRVDLLGGQKTGFYVDQRENRRRVAPLCRGKRVLNAFSYTGAFAVHALAAGASHVVNVDTSVDALELGEENLRRNGFDPDVQSVSIAGDVFDVLRDWRDEGGAALAPLAVERSASDTPDDGLFDVIVLDPPKFVHAKRHLAQGLRGYKDINLLALNLLAPGGILATFSCSGLVDAALLQKVLFGAALDAGRNVQIIDRLHQSPDHPVAITFPEGAYLSGFLCRVD